MKFSIVTIAGALASANAAAIRGDAALKKLAVMQQFNNSVNKKTFGATRRRLDQNQNNQEVTAETVLQPYVCTTATVYMGNNGDNGGNYYYNNGSSAKPTISYLSFTSVNDQNDGGYEYLYGNSDEYITTLALYLQAIGVSYAEEKANLCEDCEDMESFW
jgi:hypothetical protein